MCGNIVPPNWRTLQGCPGTDFPCNEGFLFNKEGTCVNETDASTLLAQLRTGLTHTLFAIIQWCRPRSPGVHTGRHPVQPEGGSALPTGPQSLRQPPGPVLLLHQGNIAHSKATVLYSAVRRRLCSVWKGARAAAASRL